MSAINETCPWSGKPVDAAAQTTYRGHDVGFCNPGCRDKFDAATTLFDATIDATIAVQAAPPTLLQLAGAEKHPSSLAQSVLVVIDAQHEYATGTLPLDGVDRALERLSHLLTRARRAGTVVVHIRQVGRPGGLFDTAETGAGSPGGAFLPQALPAPGEFVIAKTLPNAFANTDLEATLSQMARRPLILAGFMTHMCVGATARAALDLGYAVTVAADATATRALPDPLGGGAIPAAALQSATLAALADRFASVVPVDAIPD